jgi:DNA modification methylase
MSDNVHTELASWVPIAALKPWARNPRKNDGHPVDAVAKSIERFGFVAPIVVWSARAQIVAGHTRLKAIEKLLRADPSFVAKGAPGPGLVPVHWHEFANDAEAEAYALADNALGELAGWDLGAAQQILEGIRSQDAALAAIVAGGSSSLSTLLDALDEADALAKVSGAEVPDAPALPETAVSELGQVYELGPHRLLCGDSTNTAEIERAMDGAPADAVFTDPPYNVAYTGKTKKALKIENDAMDGGAFRAFLLGAFGAMRAVAKPGAAIYVCHADSEGENFRGAMREAGWLLKQCLVWVKDQFVLGRQDYHWQHEPILYGWAPGAAHKWCSDRKQTTVWNFDRPRRNAEHPTMKPVELIEYALGNSTDRDDVVLDSFGGSGSTLLAAARTGRRARLVELDPRYCDVIRRRWTTFARTAGIDPGQGALE